MVKHGYYTLWLALLLKNVTKVISTIAIDSLGKRYAVLTSSSERSTVNLEPIADAKSTTCFSSVIEVLDTLTTL